VSSGWEPAAAAGVRPGTGAAAGLSSDHEPRRVGRERWLGPCRLRVMATPGHAPEHVGDQLPSPEARPRARSAGGLPAEPWRVPRGPEPAVRRGHAGRGRLGPGQPVRIGDERITAVEDDGRVSWFGPTGCSR
jgi:hypothetical protein